MLQAGEYNVLVSTGVVEEDLDVGELSLIIYYELAVGVHSFNTLHCIAFAGVGDWSDAAHASTWTEACTCHCAVHRRQGRAELEELKFSGVSARCVCVCK